MSEPLLHLLRNAVDHGIETPEERIQKGKPRNGTITLSAKRDRSYVLVTISDDGKGIDPNLMREKAVQKGLLAADEAEQLTDEEALRYISTPGFSTKAETTSVSGRGVGVDVAKTRVESLGGSFQIQSEKGRGTTFLIRFPLTLAIVKALLVKVADEVFAVPVGYVVETVDIGTRKPSALGPATGNHFVAGRSYSPVPFTGTIGNAPVPTNGTPPPRSRSSSQKSTRREWDCRWMRYWVNRKSRLNRSIVS
jgi:two-component system chemotaxis sensor kinase CheA